MDVVPYPAVTLFIDDGDGLLLEDARGQLKRGSVVLGLAPGRVRGSGCHVECLQVRLSPVVAHAVLGACSSELGEAVVGFDELWGRDGARFQYRLRTAPSWEDRFALAEAALARRLEGGRATDPELTFGWGQMLTTRGMVRIERLAAEVGWSRKRLWSRFRSQVGLTPKRAARLVRFDHAAHRLAGGNNAAMVAAECGYTDQPHLNREVMAFARTTPRALAVAPWLWFDDVAWAAPAYARP